MLSQAQESVEAAEDLAQEVRYPLGLHPRQETANVSRPTGWWRDSPGHFPRGAFLRGTWVEREGEVLLAGALPWLRLGRGSRQERGPLAPPGGLSAAPGAAQPGRAAGAAAKTPRDR